MMSRTSSFPTTDRDGFRAESRRSSILRSSTVGLSSRRDLLQMQRELDDEIFDSSLGCPLTSLERATLALVGGKALQCWRLARHGFPLPSSFILPTYVHSLHVADAGVADLIEKVFASDLTDTVVRRNAVSKLKTIRDKILTTPLNSEVVTNLENFLQSLPPSSSVSVRSSGTAEDLASKSFAGQYDTFLYKTITDEIVDSIKRCWASMYKDHILDYASRSEDYIPGKLGAPKMGVLIMRMVEAEMSGVCFSRNLWGDAKEVMVEAVLGQGEGLVSGEITPDRFVLDKYSTRLLYQDVANQTHKFARAKNEDGVSKVQLHRPCDKPVLSKKNLQELTNVARAIENFYNRPQDIEWAIDNNGELYILQSRPITTVGSASNLSFLPPGEGLWTFDPSRFPRPASPWMQESYSLHYATHNSRRTGCLVKNVNIRFVHGLAFTQPEMFPPSDIPKLERAGRAYWEKRLYEDDYREFTDFFRPECEALQEELRVVDPSALSHESLVEHVADCFDKAVEFWRLHHTYTFPTIVVVGDFMNQMAALTGKSPMDSLRLLEAASPESRGILNKEDELLKTMYDLLSKSEKAKSLLRCEESMASWALDCLLHMSDGIGEVMRQVSVQYGWRLAGGYDLITPAMIESPDFFLKSILQGVEEEVDVAKVSEERAEALARDWRGDVPEEKRAEFDDILDVGRRFFRIRDERGLATDLSGIGLCRRGILEGGVRLAETGIINQPEHLCVATKDEAISLLTGDLASLSQCRRKQGVRGPVDVPTANELERRFLHIKNADPSLVPRSLGMPPVSPPNGVLPPSIGRTMAAMAVFQNDGVTDEVDDDSGSGAVRVRGLPASMGKVTGPVRLIVQDSDLQNVKKGDIVVTYSSSASFNVVLGLCAGICTDYGGMLSHAAIVAREYGIPAVVGTQNATAKFKSGDMVCIDSSTGSVTLIDSSKEKKEEN